MENGPVVFVMFRGSRPEVALARAVDLADRFGTALHVLLVSWDDALVEEPLHDDEAWLDRVLPDEVVRRYHATVGYLVHEAIEYARSHHAKMIVVPSEAGQSGSCVSAIAGTAHVCVLVARERRSRDSIVAATDMLDERMPVIEQAARMADHIDTAVVGVHNVSPASSSAAVQARRDKLSTLLEPVTLAPEVVIDCEPDPADAILRAARDRDVDLIIAGVRPRSWLDSISHPTVASRVVASARRSVLIVPLDDTTQTPRA